jgi:AGZA family xanthine/uracil permease-like MFS transporter
VLSFIGLIHATQVEWAANPQGALGYRFFGLVCVYSFLPGAKDPVEVDEADIVAGH